MHFASVNPQAASSIDSRLMATLSRPEQFLAKLSEMSAAQAGQQVLKPIPTTSNAALFRDRTLSSSSIASSSTMNSSDTLAQNYFLNNINSSFNTGFSSSNAQSACFNPLSNMNLLLSLIAQDSKFPNNGLYPLIATTPAVAQSQQLSPILSQMLNGYKLSQQQPDISFNAQSLRNTKDSAIAPATSFNGTLIIPKPIRSVQKDQVAASTTLQRPLQQQLDQLFNATTAFEAEQEKLSKGQNLLERVLYPAESISSHDSPVTSSSAIAYQQNILFDMELTPEQMSQRRQVRREKIAQYLHKKQTRRWDVLRYEVRKKIAKTRLRIKGRFVKEEEQSSQKQQNCSTCTKSESAEHF